MSSHPLAVRSFASTAELPPVVMLHGFCSTGFDDFVASGFALALTEAGHDVHVVDLPAHGDSPALDTVQDGTTRSVVAAIVSTVESVVTGPWYAVGYSLGARIAWELPAHSPVSRLVLGGISPVDPFLGITQQELRDALDGSPAVTNPIVQMMAHMISAPGRDTASLARLIAGLAAEPFAPELSPVTVPTLFAAGRDDFIAEGIDTLVALAPQSELIRVPGDHGGALHSAELREATIAFLS